MRIIRGQCGGLSEKSGSETEKKKNDHVNFCARRKTSNREVCIGAEAFANNNNVARRLYIEV